MQEQQNVLRTLGKLPALITFVGDLAKAIVPIVIIRCLFQGEEAYLLCLYLGFRRCFRTQFSILFKI